MINPTNKIDRRKMLRMMGATTAGFIIASCTPAVQKNTNPTNVAEQLQPTAQQAEVAETIVPTSQPPSTGKTKITFWSHDNVSWVASNQDTVSKFNAKYPNYEVEYTPFTYDNLQQKVQTAIPVGEGGDVIENWGDEMYGLISGGLIAPMDDALSATIKDSFWEGSYTGLIRKGKLYGFCQEINWDNGLLINKKDYDTAKISKYPETTGELMDMTKALTVYDAQGVITKAGLGWIYHDQMLWLFTEGVAELGGKYWNDDQSQVVFQTPEAETVLQAMFDTVNTYKVSSVPIDTVKVRDDLLFKGNVATQKIGPWIVPSSKVNFPDIEVDWIVGPGLTGKPRQAVNSEGWSIFVCQQSANKPGVWEFLKYKASADAQKDFISRTGLLPAMKVLKDDPDIIAKQPQLKSVMPLIGSTFFMGPIFNYSKFRGAIYNNVVPVLNKEKDIKTALADAEKEINTMLTEAAN